MADRIPCIAGHGQLKVDVSLSEPEAYAAGETYFPDEMGERRYYHPVARGVEIKIAEKMAYLRSLDQKARKK